MGRPPSPLCLPAARGATPPQTSRKGRRQKTNKRRRAKRKEKKKKIKKKIKLEESNTLVQKGKRNMVHTGLEPVTLALLAPRSNRLS